jgi:hypothetical protein
VRREVGHEKLMASGKVGRAMWLWPRAPTLPDRPRPISSTT